jgi:hypothetical protein
MDNKEYNHKRDLIASSEAPADVKAAAMAKLTEAYIGIKMKAMALINECAPDPIKGD